MIMCQFSKTLVKPSRSEQPARKSRMPWAVTSPEIKRATPVLPNSLCAANVVRSQL